MHLRDRAALIVRRTWWVIALALVAHAALIAFAIVSLDLMRAPSVARTPDPSVRFAVSSEREGYYYEHGLQTVIWFSGPSFFTGFVLPGYDVDPRPWWPAWAPRESFASAGDPELLVGVGWPTVFFWCAAHDQSVIGAQQADEVSWGFLPVRMIGSVVFLSLLLLAPAGMFVALRRGLRARRGRCPHCGYLVPRDKDICSECGQATRAPPTRLLRPRPIIALIVSAMIVHTFVLAFALWTWPANDIGVRVGPRGEPRVAQVESTLITSRVARGALLSEAIVRRAPGNFVPARADRDGFAIPYWVQLPIADVAPRDAPVMASIIVETRGVGLPVWFCIFEHYSVRYPSAEPLRPNPYRPPTIEITTDWCIYPRKLVVSLALWTLLLALIWLVLRDYVSSPS